MKIRSNRRKRRRYGRGRSDRKVFYARAGLAALLLLTIVLILRSCISKKQGEMRADVDASRPEIDVQLLDINEYSRPGIESDGITGIVIHYTANPGSTAQENRDYFEGLKDTHETSASSNFVVGLEGEIIQCVPTWEVAYASNERNKDTISDRMLSSGRNRKVYRRNLSVDGAADRMALQKVQSDCGYSDPPL